MQLAVVLTDAVVCNGNHGHEGCSLFFLHPDAGYNSGGKTMQIRKTNAAELDELMKIFARAREFMAQNGNPTQWGPSNWPPRELVMQDIEQGKSYVCEHEGRIAGTFFYDYGRDIEPTYRSLEGGSWSADMPYGLIHRIASAGTVKGVRRFCIEWAIGQCGYIRIDTHENNRPLRSLLEKLGFTYCGIVYMLKDNSPRMAFDRINGGEVK